MSSNAESSPDRWDRALPESPQSSSPFEDLVLDLTRRLAAEMGYPLPSVSASVNETPAQWFHSAEANALKEEIVAVGRKLWEREYVDGGGGNISVRLGPDYV